MRIISGKYKGRQIIAPNNLPVHPTTDMAKTALFNILNSYFNVDELDVLDLFAGTGNISYEFISRGAKSVTSVDAEKNCIRFIEQMITKLSADNIRTVNNDVFKYLSRTSDKFDLIFADPPYDLENIEEIPGLVFKNNMLKESGWLIIEHSKRNNFSQNPNFYQQRTYGKVNFSILTNFTNTKL